MNTLKDKIYENKMPDITDIIMQLNSRIVKLQEVIDNTIDPNEEMIFKDEIKKANTILSEIKNSKEQYFNNNTVIINTHAVLELAYFKAKKIIEDKMNFFQKLNEEDFKIYNKQIHLYNLFCNIVESVY